MVSTETIENKIKHNKQQKEKPGLKQANNK